MKPRALHVLAGAAVLGVAVLACLPIELGRAVLRRAFHVRTPPRLLDVDTSQPPSVQLEGPRPVNDTTFARKGDLIIVEQTHTDYVKGGKSRRYTDFTFGIVDSATRDGVVKTWRMVGYGTDLVSDGAQAIRNLRCWTASRTTVDVEGVLRAAKAHHWPGHPGQPKAFDTFEEAREVARPFRFAAVPVRGGGVMTTTYAVSLDDDPVLDEPEHFADAAQAFVGRHVGVVTAHHVAKTLSYLARCGLIVSPAEHQRVCDSYVARLAHVERAADELVARLDCEEVTA